MRVALIVGFVLSALVPGSAMAQEMEEQERRIRRAQENMDKILGVLNQKDFHNYIYGSGEATDWGTSTNYDGCTLLSEKPIVE